jgi:O-antigen/teichoic acid export membrane protein
MRSYGQEFSNDWLSLVFVSFAAIFAVGCATVGQMIAAADRMWIGAGMNVGWAVLFIGVAYIFIDYGAVGVALALCIAYIGHSIWISLYARRKLIDLSRLIKN